MVSLNDENSTEWSALYHQYPGGKTENSRRQEAGDNGCRFHVEQLLMEAGMGGRCREQDEEEWTCHAVTISVNCLFKAGTGTTSNGIRWTEGLILQRTAQDVFDPCSARTQTAEKLTTGTGWKYGK
jgi:hypothetical protein